MSHRTVVLPTLIFFLAAAGVRADHHFYRSWRDQGQPLEARVSATVEVQPGYWEPPSEGEPPEWHPPVTSRVEVFVRLGLEGDAVLRTGELETFRVETSHAFGQPSLTVKLIAERTVWHYTGQTLAYVPVEGASGSLDPVTFVLRPERRIPVAPPNVLAGFHAGTGSEQDPLVLEFDDAGRADDNGAATTYHFEVVRVRSLWPDKTVFAGVARPRGPELRQKIFIERGGPFQSTSEFLKDGSVYKVAIRVVKYGRDYTTEPSDPARFQFLFEARRRTYSRAAIRTVNFQLLHP